MLNIWRMLLGAMKEVICSIIYWCIWWMWTVAEIAFAILPSWLADPLSRFGSEFDSYLQIADLFVPLSEVIIIWAAYYSSSLSFRVFAVINSIRKV